jgi:hypothetical protein
MIGTTLNHLQIVRKSITGQRTADEQTFTSLDILSEKLERLKEKYKFFSQVDFSSDVKKLQNNRPVVVS